MNKIHHECLAKPCNVNIWGKTMGFKTKTREGGAGVIRVRDAPWGTDGPKRFWGQRGWQVGEGALLTGTLLIRNMLDEREKVWRCQRPTPAWSTEDFAGVTYSCRGMLEKREPRACLWAEEVAELTSQRMAGDSHLTGLGTQWAMHEHQCTIVCRRGRKLDS